MEGGGFKINEAVKKIRLRLDDRGARAESAVAMVMRGANAGVYTLDRPFLVIFSKPGLNFPAFVALSGPDSWTKDK